MAHEGVVTTQGIATKGIVRPMCPFQWMDPHHCTGNSQNVKHVLHNRFCTRLHITIERTVERSLTPDKRPDARCSEATRKILMQSARDADFQDPQSGTDVS